MRRLRELTEAECYARCHGLQAGDLVRVVKLPPRPVRRLPRISGEELRRQLEQRLDARVGE